MNCLSAAAHQVPVGALGRREQCAEVSSAVLLLPFFYCFYCTSSLFLLPSLKLQLVIMGDLLYWILQDWASFLSNFWGSEDLSTARIKTLLYKVSIKEPSSFLLDTLKAWRHRIWLNPEAYFNPCVFDFVYTFSPICHKRDHTCTLTFLFVSTDQQVDFVLFQIDAC